MKPKLIAYSQSHAETFLATLTEHGKPDPEDRASMGHQDRTGSHALLNSQPHLDELVDFIQGG
jgi:hypothetical protein